MSTNHTPNYQLSQWEATDKVVRSDFNADNAKLDAAIKAVDSKADGKADVSALSALQSTVSALQSAVARKQDAASAVKLKAGTYTGNGAVSQTINIGFTPKAVLVTDTQGAVYDSTGGGIHLNGGLAVTGGPIQFNYDRTTYKVLEITTNGFIVYLYSFNSNAYTIATNSSGTHHYIALA